MYKICRHTQQIGAIVMPHRPAAFLRGLAAFAAYRRVTPYKQMLMRVA